MLSLWRETHDTTCDAVDRKRRTVVSVEPAIAVRLVRQVQRWRTNSAISRIAPFARSAQRCAMAPDPEVMTPQPTGGAHAGQAGEEGPAHAAAQCARQHHRGGRLRRAGRHRAGRRRRRRASCAATRWRPSRSPRASRCSSSARSSASPPRTSRPARHVHTHNCSFAEFERDYAFAQDAREEPLLPPEARATFEGFRRANGKAGTRNYIGILTSVNCSASVARFMAEAVTRSGILEQYPNVDGVVSFVHGTGCGLAGSGEGYEALERTQWGYAGHPNLAAALVVGLGCEVFQIARLKEQVRPDRGRQLPHHDHPGHRRHQEDHRGRRRAHQGDAAARQRGAPRDHLRQRAVPGPAVRRLGRLLRHHRQPGARRRRRHPGAPRRHRRAVGDARDLRRRAPAHAARAQRARSARSWSTSSTGGRPTAPRTTARWTTTRARQQGRAASPPSWRSRWAPRPRAAPPRSTEVYRYAEPVTAKGFVYMDTPGYDPVAATGQVAGGCNVLCFTTGRGSAYGCKPTPSIKLATNHDIYQPHARRHGHQLRRHPRRRLDRGRRARRSSTPSCASPPARRPRASCSATATTSSSPGRSAPRCERASPVSLRLTEGKSVPVLHLAASTRTRGSTFGQSRARARRRL